MNSDGQIKAGESDAINLFNSQLIGKTSQFNNLKLTADIRKTNGQVSASVGFSANVPAVILGIFSKGSIAISGTSKAATGMPVYADFYLLLDNTPSMGVGATTADINTMVANTPDQCAFACHETVSPEGLLSLAKKLGVKMRIDVLRSATEQLMDTAKATETVTTSSAWRSTPSAPPAPIPVFNHQDTDVQPVDGEDRRPRTST